MSTAAIPAAIPAAAPQASAPCGPCPSRVAPTTSATEHDDRRDDRERGRRRMIDARRRPRVEQEDRQPPGGQGGADQFEAERHLPVAHRAQPEPDDEGHGQHRLHDRHRRHGEGGHLRSRPDIVAVWPSIHRRRFIRQAQAQAAVGRAQFRRLVLEHGTDGEQHRGQRGEQQPGDRTPRVRLRQRLHGSGMPYAGPARTVGPAGGDYAPVGMPSISSTRAWISARGTSRSRSSCRQASYSSFATHELQGDAVGVAEVQVVPERHVTDRREHDPGRPEPLLPRQELVAAAGGQPDVVDAGVQLAERPAGSAVVPDQAEDEAGRAVQQDAHVPEVHERR